MIWKQNFPTPRIQFASRGAMSSLAACQADGYYYPPDWTPDGGSQSLRATVGVKGAKAALGKKNGKLKPPQKNNTLRDALRRRVFPLRPNHRQRREVQRGEKGGGKVLEHHGLGFRNETRVLRDVRGDPDESAKERFRSRHWGEKKAGRRKRVYRSRRRKRAD
mmetsp:Transcript_11063/g.36513  ORF Transcript_11063/g.36513 Transcript_11063/m.36513 type:complete len:163 (+) Transcript_11063:719-1207(+)